MDLLDQFAEERIVAAMRRGECDHIESAGKPPDLDGDLFVPPESR